MLQDLLKTIVGMDVFSPAPSEKNEYPHLRTRDAKAVHTRLISMMCTATKLKPTRLIFQRFAYTSDMKEIARRKQFFSLKSDNSVLDKLKEPIPSWRPEYGVLVVTESEKVAAYLRTNKIPYQLLVTENDIKDLEAYELIQVIECDRYERLLEELPQTVFMDSEKDAFIERYLILLSGWLKNLHLLQDFDFSDLNEGIQSVIEKLLSLEHLLNQSTLQGLDERSVDVKLAQMNSELETFMKSFTITGSDLFAMMSRQQQPKEITQKISELIKASGLPQDICTRSVPIQLDETEFQKRLDELEKNKYASSAENVKKHASLIKEIPTLIESLQAYLIVIDFLGAAHSLDGDTFITYSDRLNIKAGLNPFLKAPKPISFSLDNETSCSVLTGANSGGKTTLIEHMLALVLLANLGIPVKGEVTLPLFSEIYYFAKNKGSMNKGAFETLLTQLASITPGKNTLILADEIEAVTEPGVAADIIAATIDYYAKQGCYMIVATHLGKEIQHELPSHARIDGIEAKGLDEKYQLIIDHCPVIGKLANSTPELIIEKMAKTKNKEYFTFVHRFISDQK